MSVPVRCIIALRVTDLKYTDTEISLEKSKGIG